MKAKTTAAVKTKTAAIRFVNRDVNKQGFVWYDVFNVK